MATSKRPPLSRNKSSRQTSCDNCRRDRKNCDALYGGGKCARCSRLYKECIFDGQVLEERESNDVSELRAQVKRLQSMIETMVTSEALNPAGTDIVGSLVRLCLNDQPSVSQFDTDRNKDLLKEASDLIWLDLHIDGSAHAPPVPPELDDTVSHAQLITSLPPLDVFQLLADEYVLESNWINSMSCLFTSVWYHDVIKLYRAEFKPLPSASKLAELYAWFFSAAEVHDMRRDASVYREDREAIVRAGDFEAKAWRALDLADRAGGPDLYYIRALSLMSSVKLLAERTTDHIGQGLGMVDRALVLAAELEMDDNDSALWLNERLWDRYERRALVASLLRHKWWLPSSFGRPVLVDARLYAIDPPSPLNDFDLPSYARASPYGPDALDIAVIRIRHTLARLQQQIAMGMYMEGPAVSYQVVFGNVQAVAAITRTIPRTFLASVIDDEEPPSDEVDHELDKLVAKASECKIRVLTSLLTNQLQSINMVLHRASLGAPRTQCPAHIVAFHRKEIIKWSRCTLQTYLHGSASAPPLITDRTRPGSTGRQAGRPQAGFATFIASFVVISIIVLFEAAVEDQSDGRGVDVTMQLQLRSEIQETIESLDETGTQHMLPTAVRRLVLIMRYLLERPRVDKLELERKRSRIDEPGPAFRSYHHERTRSSTASVVSPDELMHKTPSLPSPQLKPHSNSSGSNASASPSPLSDALPRSSSSLATSNLFESYDGTNFNDVFAGVTFDFRVPQSPPQ